ncbi:hypothetical protein [Anaerorhabdus sp.]|uniref:hypothetical protein n=1 Tax=Anaerorhabdus sp. TaxID=1872524 RepID=UPI002FC98085
MKLQLKCEKCKQNFNKSVAAAFEEYKVGYVVCNECKKKNSRYISESDLLMYFVCSATLYTLAVVAIYLLLNLLGSVNVFIIYGIIAFLFVGMFFLSKYICYYIYVMAPFKKEWKDKQLDEDAAGIAKRMRWQFIMFLLVALMFGSQPNLIIYCFVLLVAFIAVVGIKVNLCLRNEKAQLNIKSTK